MQNWIEKVFLPIRHLTEITINLKTNIEETKFRWSMEKYFQSVNSYEQLEQTSSRVQKPPKTIKHQSHASGNQKTFRKNRFFANSQQ